MPQYSPGNYRFPIYQISNPQDLGTLYYIQVVVRRAADLGLIQVINLTSKGNGLYADGFYQIPQDVSGQGYAIFETISVYTDPSYTTLSPNYEILNNQIDVGFMLTSASALGGDGMDGPSFSGRGGDIDLDLTDYKTIRKIIAEELKELLKNLPKEEKVNFSTKNLEEKLTALGSWMEEYKNFVANELKNHREDVARGFEGMNNNVLGISEAIGNIPLNKIIEILGPHIAGLGNGLAELHKKHDGLSKNVAELRELHKGSSKELSEENKAMAGKILQQVNDTMSDYFSSIHTMVIDKERGLPKMERKEKEPEKPDYLKLASGFIRKTATK